MAALPRVVYLRLHPPAALNVYGALADSVLRDGSLSIDGHLTTQFEPLYPIFLAVARLVGRAPLFVDLLQIAIASLGAVLLAHLTQTLTREANVAIVAAVLYAIDPLLIREAVGHSESGLFTTLLIAFAATVVSADTVLGAATAGVWLGMAILTRTTAAPLLLITPAWLVVRRRRAAAALAITAFVVVLPLPLRNHAINGSWWPTRSGVNLYIGNSVRTADLLPRDDLDLLQPDADRLVRAQRPDLDALAPADAERVADAALTREAITFMAADPIATLRRKAANVWYVVSPRIVPYRQQMQARPLADVVVFALFSTVLVFCAAAGVWMRRGELGEDAVLLWIAATIVAAAVLYVPATRYRAPMEFVLAFYAAVALGRAAGQSRVGLAAAVVDGAGLRERHHSQIAVHDERRSMVRALRRSARRRGSLRFHGALF